MLSNASAPSKSPGLPTSRFLALFLPLPAIINAMRQELSLPTRLPTGDVSLCLAMSAAPVETYGDFGDKWMMKLRKEGRAKRTKEGKEHWVSLIKVRFGKKTLGEITRGEALAFLREFEAKGHLEVCDRVRFTAGGYPRFCRC
jgi:hypothetical protein